MPRDFRSGVGGAAQGDWDKISALSLKRFSAEPGVVVHNCNRSDLGG